MKCIKKVLNFFGCICLGIITCTSIFFEYLVDDSFSTSYFHIFILMIATFVNSLCSLIGGILTAYKDSKSIGNTTVYGALINILVNILFIKKMGLFAASLSTLISYIVIFIIRNIRVRRYIRIEYPKKYSIILFISTLIVLIGYISKNKLLNGVILIYLIVFSILSNKEFIKNFILKRSSK